MYDTVNFWIPRVELLGSPFEILPFLSEITEWQNEKHGYSCTGRVYDYTVTVSEFGISLKGSLAKSFFGDNVQTLTRSAVKPAIDKVSDTLHLDIFRAKVVRVDVSTIIPVKRPVPDYFRYMGEKPRFKRLETVKDETLVYGNKGMQLAFYDKSKEASATGMQIPYLLQNSNLFRYELRFLKRVNNQLNAVVTPAILYDRDFYYDLVQKWYSEFKAVQKLKNNSFMTDNIKTPKDLDEALLAVLLQEKGQSYIDEILAELKAKNVFPDRKSYSRVRDKYNSMLKASTRSEKPELMQELEDGIYNIAKYAR
jgi:hypothetical protein